MAWTMANNQKRDSDPTMAHQHHPFATTSSGGGGSKSKSKSESAEKPRRMEQDLMEDDYYYGDEDADDDDDDLSDIMSNYSSVSEDSLAPIRAYGHTYHGSGRLLSPNDASEARRMALQHELFKLCLSGNLVESKLPLRAHDHQQTQPFHILDIGAGSGLWACEMAQKFPSASILGIDLSSALLPSDVPPNVTFEIADAMETPWPSPRRLYDFVHMRNLVGGGVRDWAALLSAAFDHLKPGGQLEFTEVRPRFFDVEEEELESSSSSGDKKSKKNSFSSRDKSKIGAACLEYEVTFAEMCTRMGLDFDPVPRVAEWLANVGAEAVRERMDWVPVKPWGNDAVMRKKGDILGEMIDCGLENWTLMLFGLSGWEEQDTRRLLSRVLQEVQDPMLKSYVKV